MLEKYGQVRVRQLVADFYDHVLRSPKLSPYFDGIDIHGLVDHQTAFLAAVMGQSHPYDGNVIEKAHGHLDIRREDFEEMIRLLENSLHKAGIQHEDVETVKTRYRGYRNAVVGAGQA